MPKSTSTATPQPATKPGHPRAGWSGWAHLLQRRSVRIALVGLVAILALAARLPILGADPPPNVSWSQDVLTDPPQYTAYARNAISFGVWNPLNDEQLIFFRKNITGAFVYLVFLVFGPGITAANLSAVAWNLLAVLFLAWGVGRAFGYMAGLASGWILAAHFLFVSYSRQPFLEVASNACLAVAFWAIISSARRWWWAAVAGIVAGLAIFFGKVTALHAAPAFLLGTVLIGWSADSHDAVPGKTPAQRRLVRPVAFASGAGAVALAWYLFAYRLASAEVLNYLKVQSLSLYGSPVGFESLSGFLHQWFSFGVDTRLLTWAPIAAVCGILGMATMVVYYTSGHSCSRVLRTIPPAAVLILGWFWSGYFAFAPFNYRPVRYQIVLWFPLAAAAGWMVQHWIARPMSESKKSAGRPVWWALPLLVVILATGLQHLIFAHLLDSSSRGMSTSGMTASIVVALLAGAIWLALSAREPNAASGSRRNKTIPQIAVALVLLASLVDQSRHFVSWWSHPQHSLEAADRDLAATLGPGAVATGEWACPLTQRRDSPGCFNHFFALEEPKDFFAIRPITHVITEDKPDAPFFKDFPELAHKAERVTTYTIRNLRIVVLRVSESGGSPKAAEYKPTFLERLRDELHTRPMDSLLMGLSRRVADSADTYSGWSLAAEVYHKVDSVDEAIDCYRRALAHDPDDFVLLAQAGDITWERYRTVGGPADREEAVGYWKRALEISPGNKQLTERLAQAGRS
ncbi:MAG: glycosyltransferase family 39 protein [candidate division Zixibacteria bacterium]|nr:glycosyltransferase family 39 protein [candidate division Zixibacteria bacterium]